MENIISETVFSFNLISEAMNHFKLNVAFLFVYNLIDWLHAYCNYELLSNRENSILIAVGFSLCIVFHLSICVSWKVSFVYNLTCSITFRFPNFTS